VYWHLLSARLLHHLNSLLGIALVPVPSALRLSSPSVLRLALDLLLDDNVHFCHHYQPRAHNFLLSSITTICLRPHCQLCACWSLSQLTTTVVSAVTFPRRLSASFWSTTPSASPISLSAAPISLSPGNTFSPEYHIHFCSQLCARQFLLFDISPLT
jgi:hypothetical protein